MIVFNDCCDLTSDLWTTVDSSLFVLLPVLVDFMGTGHEPQIQTFIELQISYIPICTIDYCKTMKSNIY